MKKRTFLRIFLAIVFFFLFFQCVGIGKIEGASMEPSLKAGEIVLINRLSYVFGKPQRGDVVAVHTNEDTYIKRIVGLPGEEISFVDGSVMIDGNVLAESYVGEQETNCVKTIQVPEDAYFLMGDNREESKDGRHWDAPCTKKGQIKGRVVYRFSDFPGEAMPRYKTNKK